MSFSHQTIEMCDLSAHLRMLREKKNVSLENAATATGISLKYLSALEAGDLTKLPGMVYAKNFLKTYARFLGGDTAACMNMFETLASRPVPNVKPTNAHHPRVLLTPRRIEWIAVILVLSAIGSYFLFEMRHLTSAPLLDVFSPIDSLALSQKTTAVDGRVESEAKVHINGEEVFVRPDGTFHETVNLQAGLNEITIQAISKKGKISEVTRTVVVE